MYRGKPAEARDGYLNYAFLQVRNVIRFVNAKGVSAASIKRFENEGETLVSVDESWFYHHISENKS